MFKKRAQGLSINVIIIAAIALLVLVVLVAIFLGRLSTTKKTIENCKSFGGRCFSFEDGCQVPYTIETTAYKCLSDITGEELEDRVCCLRV